MFGRRRYQSVTAIASTRTAASDACRQVRATYLPLTAKLKTRSLRLKEQCFVLVVRRTCVLMWKEFVFFLFVIDTAFSQCV